MSEKKLQFTYFSFSFSSFSILSPSGLLTLVELEQLLVMSCLTALTIQVTFVQFCCHFLQIPFDNCSSMTCYSIG